MPAGLVADGLGLGVEVEGDARVITPLSILASGQQRPASGFKGAMKSGEELEGTLSEEFSLSLLGDVGVDSDAGDARHDVVDKSRWWWG